MTTAKKTTIEVTGYASEVRFYSTRYKQGGRTVYSLDLSIAQIVALLPAPDPDRPQPGNRRIQPQHAAAFGEYIRSQPEWVSPALVLRAPASFDFSVIEAIEGAEFGIMSLPTLSVGDIHILDGQHRILGMHMAVKAIGEDLDEARDQLAQAKKAGDDPNLVEHYQGIIKNLTAQRKRFEVERTSIQIFVETSQRDYQQMFVDINDNTLGVTASVRARFDTRKITNRVLGDIMLHPLLVGRVDMERDRLGRINANFLSAKHVVDIVRIIAVGLEGRISRRLESELQEADLAPRTMEFFDTMCEAFHQLEQVKDGVISPAELRQYSMLGSPVTIRVLAGAFYELRAKGFDHEAIVAYFQRLDPFLSAAATDFLVKRTGDNVFFEGALSPSSRRQDLKELRNVLTDWAESEPHWLAA